jgi:hypothetical protein
MEERERCFDDSRQRVLRRRKVSASNSLFLYHGRRPHSPSWFLEIAWNASLKKH